MKSKACLAGIPLPPCLCATVWNHIDRHGEIIRQELQVWRCGKIRRWSSFLLNLQVTPQVPLRSLLDSSCINGSTNNLQTFFHFSMTRFATNIILFCVAVIGFMVFQGCSKNPLGTVKVTGKVTLDGVPVEGVTVAFYPKSSDCRECFGLTNAQGQYVLTVSGAEPGSGAIPGEYGIVLTKLQKNPASPSPGAGSPDEERSAVPMNPGPPPPPVHLLPAKYADKSKTDIAPVTVEKGKKNEFMFELSTK